MKLFIVTDPENGWDCIKKVYWAYTKQQVKEYELKAQGLEIEPEFWKENNIIHEKEVISLL